MAKVPVVENIDEGRVALVTGLKTPNDTYLDARISKEDPIVVLEISGEVILATVEDIFDDKLSDIVVTSQSEPVVCSKCGSKGRLKAISSTTFKAQIIDTLQHSDDSQRVVALGAETKYHCEECFEQIRDLLEYHIQHGKISSQLTIRNI